MPMTLHFAPESNNWATPWPIFKKIESRFGPFHLDPCCTDLTAKCNTYITKKQNGLNQSWDIAVDRAKPTRVFMNPPYGREIAKWMKKAYEESRKGVYVICLIHPRTDTAWWHDYAMKAAQIIFIRGRVQFEMPGKKPKDSQFPSCLVVFSPFYIDSTPKLDTMTL